MGMRSSALALVPLALIMSACPAAPAPTPEIALKPDTVGRLIDVEDPAPGKDVYVLDVDGSRFELDDDAIELRGHPSLDGLVMVGSIGAQAWYVALGDPYPTDETECFLLHTGSAINEGATILFPIDEMYGLRLAKGADWREPDQGMDGDRYPSWLRFWCVNVDGQVISVEAGAAH